MNPLRRHLLTPSLILLASTWAVGALLWVSLAIIEHANKGEETEFGEVVATNAVLQAVAEYALHAELVPSGEPPGEALHARSLVVVSALEALAAKTIPEHRPRVSELRAEFDALRKSTNAALADSRLKAARTLELRRFENRLRDIVHEERAEGREFTARTAATIRTSRQVTAVMIVLSLLASAIALRLAFKHVREREASQRVTARSEARLRALLLGLPDGVIVHEGGEILLKNAPAEQLLRADGGDSLLDERGDAAGTTTRVRVAPGIERSIERSFGTIVFEGKDAQLVLLRDITERAQLQQRVAHSERLAAVGTLAAGVAHEINNPTAFILSNVEFALDRLGSANTWTEADVAELSEALGDAKDGARRVAAIVRDLKLLARADSGERHEVDLREVVERTARLVRGGLNGRAELKLDFEGDLTILATETQLSQVFTNLMVNAVQAIPAGEPGRHLVTVRGKRQDTTVIVDVTDTGTGMSLEQLGRIFEPFFTTKPVGEGTGLGLSIARGILRGLGGDIEASSRPGCGTTFRITLPAAQPTAGRNLAKAPEGPTHATARSSKPRVLVIDDEAAITAAVRRALASEYDVTLASSAQQALGACAVNSFDVILCDVVMPHTDGIGFYRRLEAGHPALALRTVFMTGATFSDESRAFVASRPLLEKPFEAAQLRATIAEVIDGGVSKWQGPSTAVV